MFTVRVYFEK